MNKLPFKQLDLEGFLVLVGFMTLSVASLLIISWLMATAISVIMSIVSVITFEAVLISLFAGIATFVTGAATYNTWQEARANKELADKLEGMDDYEARKEVWEEMIKEEQEKKEREVELEGDKL